MLHANVTIDYKEVEKMLANFKSQAPYVLQKSMNDTMLEAQEKMVSHINKKFMVRRAAFVKRSVKMMQFAKKTNLTAVLGIAGIAGKDTADILAKFETGKDKTPYRGGSVAVPTIVVRPNASRVVSKNNRPRALARSFRITTKAGDDLILRRKGKGSRSKTQVAYVLKDSVPIDSRLTFAQVVTDVINRRYGYHFSRWYAKAIETSR